MVGTPIEYAAMTEDAFLFSLILNAGRRGTHFVIKAEAVDGVVDNWLYLLSGIPPERQNHAGLTTRRVQSLALAARIIKQVPVFTQRSSDGSITRYRVVRDYLAEN